VPNVDKALVRLRTDHAAWARECAKIVDKRKQLVPLELRPWQHEFQAEIAKQRDAGVPIRGIILKARQLGFSTDIQATFVQECTLNSYEEGLTVAQDLETAGKLFGIGHRIYHNLPPDPRVKPGLLNERDSMFVKYMRWVNGSSYNVETASDKLAGRGTTPSKLHLSEIAHYPEGSIEALLGLLNGVPDTPTSMIFKESTANGRNHFERDWNDAVQGISGYFHIFVPWWKDPEYVRAFASLEEREAFEASVGEGEIGEDEPMLIERFGLSLEQLNWRRFAIRTKTNHDIVKFKQEYPAFPEEAFAASGRLVFSVQFVSRVLARIDAADKPEIGVLRDTKTETKRTREGTVDVPTEVEFTPIAATGFNPYVHPTWAIYAKPVDRKRAEMELASKSADEQPLWLPGQYVIGVDVAGEEDTTSTGDTAYHAIQVIDHVTKRQVARWRARCAIHELTREAVLAAVFYNDAILAVEITGGWGGPVAHSAWRQYGYPHVYRRQKIDGRNEKTRDLLGWQTDSMTRPEIIANLGEQLAEGNDGVLDWLTADEMTTFIYNEKGKPVPEVDHFSDLLFALMIAKMVARLRRPRRNRKAKPPAPVRPVTQTHRYG
jgi:hypothetical protein